MIAATQSAQSGENAIVVGMGELGSVFAVALLRRGIAITPILRSTPIEQLAQECREPDLCVITVGENALDLVLDSGLRKYSDRWVLVQNELRPSEWERRGLSIPTVAIVWFEKKPGRDARALVSTPVYGPKAPIIVHALSGLGLPAHIETDPERLVFEMALKNLYILATNFAGLVHDADVGTLWTKHQPFMNQICDEVIELESAQMQRVLPVSSLKIELERIVTADPRHVALGRSARNRLGRALVTARKLGLSTPILDGIAQRAEEH
jgi:ketopantoate reductase